MKNCDWEVEKLCVAYTICISDEMFKHLISETSMKSSN
jgi:hypothetical protein